MAETKEYRSKMMSKIRSTGGKAEVMLGKSLWHQGIRYYRNYKKLPGKPDLAISKYKTVVFIDGEFWHGKTWDKVKSGQMVHKNREYWLKKISYNMKHDQQVNEELISQGWTVIRFWSREVEKNCDYCTELVMLVLRGVKENSHEPKVYRF